MKRHAKIKTLPRPYSVNVRREQFLSQPLPVNTDFPNPAHQVRATIVIPAYKAGQFIGRALQSASSQSEKDVEIIVVDDGSPDDTWAVASQWSMCDPRIRVFRLPENRGKPHAFNYALQKACGEWIAILDADDWMAPTRIERLIDEAEAAHVDMAADNLAFVDIKANAMTGTAFPPRGETLRLDLDMFLRASDPTARYDYGMLQPVIRTDFLRKHRLKCYEPARTGEDFYFHLRFFAAGGRAVVIDEPLYFYIQPFGTLSRQWSHGDRKPYNFELIKKINDHFVSELRGTLSPHHMRILEKRGQKLETMAAFHRIRQSLKDGNWQRITGQLAKAPPQLWPLALRRGISRVAQIPYKLRHSASAKSCAVFNSP